MIRVIHSGSGSRIWIRNTGIPFCNNSMVQMQGYIQQGSDAFGISTKTKKKKLTPLGNSN
jgi:hypothetical protein